MRADVCQLLASLPDDAGTVAAVGTGVAAVFGLAGLLVKSVIGQQSGWEVLVGAAERRAREADARVVVAEREASLAMSRAHECGVQLTAAQQVANAAQDRAVAAEQRAVAAEGRADLVDLQLDELRRQLAEARGPQGPGT